MTRADKHILYISKQYATMESAANIRCHLMVKALIANNYRVTLITAGKHPEIISENKYLTVITLTANGVGPKRPPATNPLQWPLLSVVPGPDADRPYLNSTLQQAQNVIEANKIDLIIASGPPFYLLAGAKLLAQHNNLPFIVELRDLWYHGVWWPYKHYLDAHSAKKHEALCVKKAKGIITVTKISQDILMHAYGSAKHDKFTTVRHGCPKEKPITTTAKNNHIFKIVYTGQLRGINIANESATKRLIKTCIHTILSVTIGKRRCHQLKVEWMSPHYLIEAMAMAAKELPELKAHIQLTFAGESFKAIDQWAVQHGLENQIVQLGKLNATDAQTLAMKSDLLMINLYGLIGPKKHWCIPSKIYNYLATGKPVLGLLPPGEAADILKEAKVGFICHPTNVKQISAQLINLYNQHRSGGIKLTPNQTYINTMSQSVQQKKYLTFIKSVLNTS